ncbi:hypothetical protein [Streptomyces sp. NBC_00203]|uniref:hypothetical protein n=1 Tax=Streptomyces sp. NBC_00203 TaxID=2975680 RepID=UPI003247F0CB
MSGERVYVRDGIAERSSGLALRQAEVLSGMRQVRGGSLGREMFDGTPADGVLTGFVGGENGASGCTARRAGVAARCGAASTPSTAPL